MSHARMMGISRVVASGGFRPRPVVAVLLLVEVGGSLVLADLMIAGADGFAGALGVNDVLLAGVATCLSIMARLVGAQLPARSGRPGALRSRSGQVVATGDRPGISFAVATDAFLLLTVPTQAVVGVVAASHLVAAMVGERRPLAVAARSATREVLIIATVAPAIAGLRVLGGPDAGLLVAAAGATVLFSALRAGLAALTQAERERLPIMYVWRRSGQTAIPHFLLLAAVGAVAACLVESQQPAWLGLPLVLSALAVFRSIRDATALQEQTVASLSSLADLVDSRDSYTHGHSQRVAEMSERLAVSLGLRVGDCQSVYLAARLHDLGKCGVSNEVLRKAGPLSEVERAEMQEHVRIGAEMLEHFPHFRDGAQYVRAHHEWYDGRGYPGGLARSAIPLGARIIAVTDAYDAMTTDRPYRQALPHSEAVRRLWKGAGSQWDPRIVERFMELLGESPARARSRSSAALPTAVTS